MWHPSTKSTCTHTLLRTRSTHVSIYVWTRTARTGLVRDYHTPTTLKGTCKGLYLPDLPPPFWVSEGDYTRQRFVTSLTKPKFDQLVLLYREEGPYLERVTGGRGWQPYRVIKEGVYTFSDGLRIFIVGPEVFERGSRMERRRRGRDERGVTDSDKTQHLWPVT